MINEEFNIPYYIFEEIVEYIELSAKEGHKMMKWENIKILLNIAKLNNRLTEEQVTFLLDNYCRKDN